MARDTSLRPRGRRYSFAEHGQSETSGLAGRFILSPSASAEHWTPAYGNGVTTIRIFPTKSPEDSSVWEPYRFNAEINEFGDWLRRYPAARKFGDPSVTFLMDDPSDRQCPDPQSLPPWVLFNAIDKAVARGQDQQGWAALLRGGANRSPQLPRPSEVYLVQCCVMKNKQKVYIPPKGFGADDKLIIMELSSHAGNAFVHELNQVKEDYQGADDDWESMFVNGDPISLNHGRFVTFYKLAEGDPRQVATAVASGWDQPSVRGGASGGQGSAPIGYGCYLEDQFNSMPASMVGYEALVSSKVQQWDSLVQIKTVEEQAHLLADKFPPDVIMYAFSDHPEWIPEAVRRRAVAATTVAVTGTPPEAAPAPANPAAPVGTVPTGGAAWGTPPEGGIPPAVVPAQPPAAEAPVAPVAMPEAPSAPPAAAPPAAMGWGEKPGLAGPPAPVQPAVDPALPSGGIPAEPISAQPATAFATPPAVPAASPAGNGGQPLTRAQAALAVAQAHAAKRAQENGQ